MSWSVADIPDQSGRTAVVTGANSGLGLQTALALAGSGAHVLLGCRDISRGEQAARRIREAHPAASVAVLPLDLADLASIERAAEQVVAGHDRLDLLVNNAGIMAPPRRETVDGFELQLGTNHLGHFALTGRLIGLMTGVEDSRVVTVSSSAHAVGHFDFDDLMRERSYGRAEAYGQSKLANLLFTFELNRRLIAANALTLAAAAHPGYAATNLQTSGPGMGRGGILARLLFPVVNLVMGQSEAAGALPQLYAATAPDVVGGEYFGPRGPREMRGPPTRVLARSRAYDDVDARRLWEVSEQLTGVRYADLAG